MADTDLNPGGDGPDTLHGTIPPVSWREDLPENIRENPHLTRYDSKEAAAKGFIEAQDFISRTRPLPAQPKDDAPVEEWDKFFTAMGRPEKPEGYEFAKPEKLPEGYTYPEEQIGKFREIAHKAGLTPKQFQDIVSSYQSQDVGFFQEIIKDGTEREAAVTAALQKEWGRDYEANLNLARKTTQHYIKNDEDWGALALALNNNERLVKLFHRIGKDMSEDTLRGAGVFAASDTLRQKAAALMAEAMKLGSGDMDYRKKLDEAQQIYEQIEKEEAARATP